MTDGANLKTVVKQAEKKGDAAHITFPRIVPSHTTNRLAGSCLCFFSRTYPCWEYMAWASRVNCGKYVFFSR